VAIKLPTSDASQTLLAQECRMLQRLAASGRRGRQGVPRVVGWCREAGGRRALMTQPVGRTLAWSEWDGLALAKHPLHMLVGQLVGTLQAAHKRHIINRDIRPSNIIVADGELVVIDWGFAEVCAPGALCYRGPYSGTASYASASVLQQFIASVVDVEVGPADDLVSLVRCMFAVQHPAAQAQLGLLRGNDAAVAKFWEGALDSRRRWRQAEAAAAKCAYGRLRTLLRELLE
jgi:hypothetical protein